MYSESCLSGRITPVAEDRNGHRNRDRSPSLGPSDRRTVVRIPRSEDHPRPAASGRDGWHLPVMPATLLLADVVVQEYAVDLERLSQIILSDLGATLKVLRLAGSEYDDAGERPFRMAECIAVLGPRACVNELGAGPMLREFQGDRRRRIAELWSRSRAVAQQARRIADEGGAVDPEQAYLVGLCHQLGSLPGVLGWVGARRTASNTARDGAELARAWSLPGCVVAYFSQLQAHAASRPWPWVVRSAMSSLRGEAAVFCNGAEAPLRLPRAV